MRSKSITLLSLLIVTSTTIWGNSAQEVYKTKCANCHGDKADGDTKIISQTPMIKTKGVAFTNLSQEEILQKLQNLRKNGNKLHDGSIAMREYLKAIESGVGKISDEEMAAYIYNTFGKGDTQ
ncbi:MAG: c-type cytochrome [Campylobacterales bacterium]|nr:c-type cytochrome [Campylobacterales bacterium]